MTECVRGLPPEKAPGEIAGLVALDIGFRAYSRVYNRIFASHRLSSIKSTCG